MHSIVVEGSDLPTVKAMIPIGVEHYVFAEKDKRYINIRTSDAELVAKLNQVAAPANTWAERSLRV